MVGLRWLLHEVVVLRREVLHLEYISAVRETIFCDHILCQCRVCIDHVRRFLSTNFLRKFFAQNINAGLDHGLEPPDRCLGEKITESGASSAVNIMAHSPKGHISTAKHTRGPRPFLYIFSDGGIELICEARIRHVKLIRINADDRTYKWYQRHRSFYVSHREEYRRPCAFPGFPRRTSLF